MTLASSWMDLVVGVDCHIEVVPTPAPTPTPFPHPFAGVIFDPVGYVAGEVVGAVVSVAMGQAPAPTGPVLIGPMMATVTGDACKQPIKHILIPPGTTFAKGLPPSDAELLVGSKTVLIRGSAAVRVGEIAMPCSEPVRLPLGKVVATSSGAAVTKIGGPPGVDWGSALMMLGMKGLRSKWVSDKIHGLVDKVVPKKFRRLRNMAHKSACFFTGHPVDVASGCVTTDATDLSLPGPIPLRLRRQYSSNWSDRDSPLGFGWSHSLDQRIWIEPDTVVFALDDGREVEFDTFERPDRVMRRGDEARDEVNRLTLRSLGQFAWEVSEPGGITKRFAPIPGEAPTDTDRGLSRLVEIRDRAGHKISLRYDEHARLCEVTDAVGRTISFEYDRAGRLAFVWVPEASGPGVRQQLAYRYSGEGDLVAVTDAAGGTWRFEYDEHLLVRETNRNDLSFYFIYDDKGPYARCIRTWGDGGIYDHALVYDRQAQRTVVTNSLGEATTYECNAFGLVVALTQPNGATTRFEYDHALRKTAEHDALGHATLSTYDERGNRVMVVGPDKAVTKYGYDERDQLVEIRQPNGTTWSFSYDSSGHLVSRTDPLRHVTQYRYEDCRLAAAIEPTGATTSFAYDSHGNVVTATRPSGAVEHWSYDALGRCISRTDVRGQQSRRVLDALGRVVRVETPDGNVTELAYDREGNVVRRRDARRDVELRYCGLNRVAGRTVGGHTVAFEYDTEDQLIAIVDELGHRTSFELDVVGEIAVERALDGIERRFERDLLGRVVRTYRGDPTTHIAYEYDAAGRVVLVAPSDGPAEMFAYDELGLLREAKGPDATITFERDALGQVTEERRGDFVVESRYDHAGRRLGLASSQGATQAFERNEVGDLIAAKHRSADGTWEAVFERDLAGAELRRTVRGGVVSQWWRDAVGRPTQHFVSAGDRLHRGRRYAWAAGDRLASLDEEGRGETRFEHDGRGYLVQATHPGGAIDPRYPDGAGNLHRSRDGSDREYGAAGQLLRTAEASYVYDRDGRLAEKGDAAGTWRYHFDGADRLVQVDRPDGRAVAFTYDALGRRLTKNFDGVVTHFVWDGDRILHQWEEVGDAPQPRLPPDARARLPYWKRIADALHDDAPQLRARLTEAVAEGDEAARLLLARLDHESDARPPPRPEPITWLHNPDTDEPLARITSDSRLAIHCDHLGTPLCLTDDAGELAWQGSHDLRGRTAVLGDATLCPFRYPGQYDDPETGLHQNRHRHYDPATGTYLSRDPLGLRGGLHPYTYVPDPLTQTDPLGLTKQSPGGCQTNDARSADGPGFVVTPTGEAIPIPSGATGPSPTRASGFMFEGGTGGYHLDERVAGVRIMDANVHQGPRAVFMNDLGQTVDPATGRTVARADPAGHHYLDPWG